MRRRTSPVGDGPRTPVLPRRGTARMRHGSRAASARRAPPSRRGGPRPGRPRSRRCRGRHRDEQPVVDPHRAPGVEQRQQGRQGVRHVVHRHDVPPRGAGADGRVRWPRTCCSVGTWSSDSSVLACTRCRPAARTTVRRARRRGVDDRARRGAVLVDVQRRGGSRCVVDQDRQVASPFMRGASTPASRPAVGGWFATTAARALTAPQGPCATHRPPSRASDSTGEDSRTVDPCATASESARMPPAGTAGVPAGTSASAAA